jgi:hypothetical protein
MPFDPTKPAENSPNSSAEMRGQLTGLKALIDAVPAITAAAVDAVNTLPAGDPASVSVSVTGGTLHFTFNLPAGNDGPPGNDGPAGNDGAEGPQGPPFASAVVDSVNTLDPWESATVDASFDGSTVHLTFGIPRGYDGPSGSDGMPGEVSSADLNNAIAGTSANTNSVSTLGYTADPDYNAGQMQDLMSKMDELINALRR